MSELRTLKSARGGSRVRGVQGRLSIDFGDGEASESPRRTEPTKSVRPGRPRRAARPQAERRDEPPRPAPVFHPLAYRSVIAEWPIECRERWGLRANDLEDTGLSWRDAETQAFVEAWNEIRQGGTCAGADVEATAK